MIHEEERLTGKSMVGVVGLGEQQSLSGELATRRSRCLGPERLGADRLYVYVLEPELELSGTVGAFAGGTGEIPRDGDWAAVRAAIGLVY